MLHFCNVFIMTSQSKTQLTSQSEFFCLFIIRNSFDTRHQTIFVQCMKITNWSKHTSRFDYYRNKMWSSNHKKITFEGGGSKSLIHTRLCDMQHCYVDMQHTAPVSHLVNWLTCIRLKSYTACYHNHLAMQT